MNINELRRLYEMGQLSPAEMDQAEEQNYLRTLVTPQPIYGPESDLPTNSMRFNNGPQEGKLVDLNFAPQAAQRPAQKLGAEVDVVGRGKGRYAPDGRSVVFDDGSKQSLFPMQDMAAFKQWFEGEKAKQSLAKGDLDMAQTQQQMELARQPKERPAPPGYRFRSDMSLEPIPGGPADMKVGKEGEQRTAAAEAAADTVAKIDAMIGKRDATGALVEGSKPHEGFEDAVGSTWKPFARHIPGTDASDFQARLDEVKGGAFLKAFETLKGGGQITQIEGEKATAAITRMSTAQSEAEFVKAALEFRDVVQRGLDRMRGGRSPQGGAPQVGEVRKGYRYKGGNPASQSSWEKVQ